MGDAAADGDHPIPARRVARVARVTAAVGSTSEAAFLRGLRLSSRITRSGA